MHGKQSQRAVQKSKKVPRWCCAREVVPQQGAAQHRPLARAPRQGTQDSPEALNSKLANVHAQRVWRRTLLTFE